MAPPGAADVVQQRLKDLQLSEATPLDIQLHSSPMPVPQPRPGRIRAAGVFQDLIAASPSRLLLPASSGQPDPEAEDLLLDCFAQVFHDEVCLREAEAGGAALPLDDKRQLLADILVWAEVLQPHYNAAAQSFVTAPHDARFQRLGAALKAAKQQRGLP